MYSIADERRDVVSLYKVLKPLPLVLTYRCRLIAIRRQKQVNVYPLLGTLVSYAKIL